MMFEAFKVKSTQVAPAESVPMEKNVMISYSRIDSEIMKKILNRFQQDKRSVWVDLQDIPPTADWMQEIKDGIQRSNSIIILLSPAWLSSKICREEAECAFTWGKRIIPVVVGEVQYQNVECRLSSLNWIFCRPTDDFDKAYEKIIQSLDNDLEVLKLHTKLLHTTLHWETNGRKPCDLIVGDSLAKFDEFLDKVEEMTSARNSSVPNITANMYAFIQACHAEEAARGLRDQMLNKLLALTKNNIENETRMCCHDLRMKIRRFLGHIAVRSMLNIVLVLGLASAVINYIDTSNNSDLFYLRWIDLFCLLIFLCESGLLMFSYGALFWRNPGFVIDFIVTSLSFVMSLLDNDMRASQFLALLRMGRLRISFINTLLQKKTFEVHKLMQREAKYRCEISELKQLLKDLESRILQEQRTRLLTQEELYTLKQIHKTQHEGPKLTPQAPLTLTSTRSEKRTMSRRISLFGRQPSNAALTPRTSTSAVTSPSVISVTASVAAAPPGPLPPIKPSPKTILSPITSNTPLKDLTSAIKSRIHQFGMTLQGAFQLFDSDKNGTLSALELRNALNYLQLEEEGNSSEQLIKVFDANDDGSVSMPEFLSVFGEALVVSSSAFSSLLPSKGEGSNGSSSTDTSIGDHLV
eukprot:GILI01011674.1.p1 GENE.GILI01011674.1~~GILI01011674.1.p1  ORF type:complete len:638 (+),score=114.65 GILI01011674.1:126-2039(+)